jgi:hypothetical protein
VSSPAVRHVDVQARHQMVPGDVYTGWVCKNKSCGRVIAIAATTATGRPTLAEADDRLIVIKCPHCGDEDLYRWGARGEHPYTAVTAAT